MKIYYFTVIITGLMFLMYLGGIQTNTSNVINMMLNNGNLEFSKTNVTFWVAIAAVIAGAIALAGAKVSLGVVSWSGSIESVVAVFIGAIYSLFIIDLISIINKLGSITCTKVIESTGACVGLVYHTWVYWTAWAIIVPLLVGMGISIVEFIRGGD